MLKVLYLPAQSWSATREYRNFVSLFWCWLRPHWCWLPLLNNSLSLFIIFIIGGSYVLSPISSITPKASVDAVVPCFGKHSKSVVCHCLCFMSVLNFLPGVPFGEICCCTSQTTGVSEVQKLHDHRVGQFNEVLKKWTSFTNVYTKDVTCKQLKTSHQKSKLINNLTIWDFFQVLFL